MHLMSLRVFKQVEVTVPIAGLDDLPSEKSVSSKSCSSVRKPNERSSVDYSDRILSNLALPTNGHWRATTNALCCPDTRVGIFCLIEGQIQSKFIGNSMMF